MTNPMANPEPVPQRFGEAPPASLYEQHMAMHAAEEAEAAVKKSAVEEAETSGDKAQKFGEEASDAVAANQDFDFSVSANGVTADEVREALRDVIDPELGINVVDLGLLYGVAFTGPDEVTLEMTLTSAACPLTDVIEEQARMVLASMVSYVNINWVWIPPWGPECITEEGREQLRALGFNV